MTELLDTWFGDTGATVARFVIAFLAVLLALVVVRWGMRRYRGGQASGSNRNRQPRLAVMDVAVVDARRRLVLVRRDNVEHLLMIGGPTDIVVEQTIIRGVPVGTLGRLAPRHAGAAEPAGNDAAGSSAPQDSVQPAPQVQAAPPVAAPPAPQGRVAPVPGTEAQPMPFQARSRPFIRPAPDLEPEPVPEPSLTRGGDPEVAHVAPEPAPPRPAPDLSKRMPIRPAEPPRAPQPFRPTIGLSRTSGAPPRVTPAPVVSPPEPTIAPAGMPPSPPLAAARPEPAAASPAYDDLARRLDEALRLESEDGADPAPVEPPRPQPIPERPGSRYYVRPTRGPAARTEGEAENSEPSVEPAPQEPPAPEPAAPPPAPRVEKASVLGAAGAWFRPRSARTAPEPAARPPAEPAMHADAAPEEGERHEPFVEVPPIGRVEPAEAPDREPETWPADEIDTGVRSPEPEVVEIEPRTDRPDRAGRGWSFERTREADAAETGTGPNPEPEPRPIETSAFEPAPADTGRDSEERESAPAETPATLELAEASAAAEPAETSDAVEAAETMTAMEPAETSAAVQEESDWPDTTFAEEPFSPVLPARERPADETIETEWQPTEAAAPEETETTRPDESDFTRPEETETAWPEEKSASAVTLVDEALTAPETTEEFAPAEAANEDEPSGEVAPAEVVDGDETAEAITPVEVPVKAYEDEIAEEPAPAETTVDEPIAEEAATPAADEPAPDRDRDQVSSISARLADDLARILETEALEEAEQSEPEASDDEPRLSDAPAGAHPAPDHGASELPAEPKSGRDADFSSLEDEMARLLDEIAGDAKNRR